MVSFGLFLNGGAQLGPSHGAVFDLMLAEAGLAERLGYADLWVSEHHFIEFGINSNALTLAGFLLGRTRRVRVGTAVTLAPQYHPMQLAEQAAILDQCSGGRFDFGIGRGGYALDFERFGTDPQRWSQEVEFTARQLLRAWTRRSGDPASVLPYPRTQPHPPLFLATGTPAAVALAAERGLPLLHYFATPPDARVTLEAAYLAARPAGSAPARHVHCLIVVVDDDAVGARERLFHALSDSFRRGDHPHVEAAAGRHLGPDGRPVDRQAMARMVADGAIVGPPAQVAGQLRTFIKVTDATRLVIYAEAIGDAVRTVQTIERFGTEVMPRFQA